LNRNTDNKVLVHFLSDCQRQFFYRSVLLGPSFSCYRICTDVFVLAYCLELSDSRCYVMIHKHMFVLNIACTYSVAEWQNGRPDGQWHNVDKMSNWKFADYSVA